MKRFCRVTATIVLPIIAILLCSLPAMATETKDSRCASGITVIAHRGTGNGTVMLRGKKYSEDTVPSAVIAVRLGACGREYDLQISRDHVLFVHHDPTVDRMTRGHGPIKQHLASWVRRWRNPDGSPIATFGALLRAAVLAGGYHQQEFKPFGFADSDLQYAMALNHKYIADERLVLRTSSQAHILCKLDVIDRQYMKDNPDDQFDGYANGLINFNPRGRFNLTKVNDNCVDVLMLNILALDRAYVRAAHKAGFEVSARSVNTVAAFRRVKAWGVDRVVTDKPWILRGRR